MRTTVELPEPLIQHAKLMALERGVTLSKVVEDALRIHLSLRGGALRGKVRLPTVSGRLVDPELELERTSSLTVAEDERFFEAGRRA